MFKFSFFLLFTKYISPRNKITQGANKSKVYIQYTFIPSVAVKINCQILEDLLLQSDNVTHKKCKIWGYKKKNVPARIPSCKFCMNLKGHFYKWSSPFFCRQNKIISLWQRSTRWFDVFHWSVTFIYTVQQLLANRKKVNIYREGWNYSWGTVFLTDNR
jgi:hypothetical protein